MLTFNEEVLQQKIVTKVNGKKMKKTKFFLYFSFPAKVSLFPYL